MLHTKRARSLTIATPARWLLVLTLACQACGDDDGPGGSGGPGPDDVVDPKTDVPEVLENASGAVAEADIRAAIIDDDIEVLLPLQRRGEGKLAGIIQVSARDARADEVLGVDHLDIDQDDDLAHHRLVIEGAGAGLARGDTATIMLDWRVELPKGDLQGRRSLYAALGRLEVLVRGPTTLPSSGTSPLRVIVRDVKTGKPVEGAALTGTLLPENDEPNELFEAESDEEGEHLAQIALPMGIDAARLRVDVRTDDAHVWTHVQVSRATDQHGIYLSADKTIYKPGQSVGLRALALGSADRTPLADAEAVFEAKDARGNKVFRARVDTDEFGVAATEVPTDVRVNEGDWRFSVAIDGRTQELVLPVTRYILPKMNVRVDLQSTYANPGDALTGSVEAFYVFGEPVANADVQLVVQADTLLSLNVAGKTDAEGHFSFSVQVPSDVNAMGMDSTGVPLTFSATVTDAAQQVERGGTAIPLTNGPLLIEVVNEFGAAVPGIDNRMFVVVTDPAGRPVVADLEVDAIGQDLIKTTTNSRGLAEINVRPPRSSLNMRVTATDGAERSHTRFINLTSQDGDQHLAVRSEHSLYGPGDVVRLELLSDADLTRAHVDVFQGSRGVHSEDVALTDDGASFEFVISQEMRGVLVVDAYGYDSQGSLLRASRRLLVEGADRLNVSLSSDADTYLPGGEATVTVAVTDSAGDPQVASIGLTAVDEASFLLGGEPTHSLVRQLGFDQSALPAQLAVLNWTSDSLIGGTRDSRSQAADLLLSRAGSAETPVFYYDAVETETPQVQSAVSQLLQVEANKFLTALEERVGGSGTENEELLRAARALAANRIDPFGQPYMVMVDEPGLRVTFLSAGPDEQAGTDDDASAEVYIGQIAFRGQNNGAPGQFPMTGAAAGDGDGFALDDAQAPEPTVNAPPAEESGEKSEPGGPSVRKDFRETVYNNPVLITDGEGRATVSFPLAHSITSWRVSADGSTRDGKIGSARHGFRTFQSFFVDFDVPTRLTKGDVIQLPAVVYNYLDSPADVTVSLQPDAFFTAMTNTSQMVSLGPSEVRAVTFQVRIDAAGEHTFTLLGQAGSAEDAIARTARVDPDGDPEDVTFSDRVESTKQHTFDLPADTVEGGRFLTLSLTPGFAAEAVSGLDSMIQEPNGCFEQTTATAWPNTLIAHYLEQTDQLDAEKKDEIRGTVIRGYQRLLTFESPTGGFNWWGDAEPGNRILSAILLWHLKDLEELIEIDEAVRDRTLSWLVDQQQSDGSWQSGDELHAGNEVLGTSEVRTTAFITWALAHTGWADEAVTRAGDYLKSHQPPNDDIYANALSANAMAIIAPVDTITNNLFTRLDGLKKTDSDGRVSWPTETPSWTGAGGGAAAIETTGLVAYGLMTAGAYPDDSAGAVSYLIANKDSVGSWYSTQATMNALRALSAASQDRGSDTTGILEVRVNGALVDTIDVGPDTNDLHREFDLSAAMQAGQNQVDLTFTGTGDVSYRLTRRAYRPAPPMGVGPLDIAVDYDTTTANVGDTVTCDVTVSNNDPNLRNQVIARVGRAPGMSPREEDLRDLVSQGLISRYEVRDKDVTLYLMGMRGGEVRKLGVRFIATLAAQATAPGSIVYAYYEPLLKRITNARRFDIR